MAFWCLCAKPLHLCPTLCDPMDCSLPGSSVHGNSPGKNAGVGYHALLHGNLPDPGIEPMSPAAPALQADSLPRSHHGSLFLFGFALTEMKEFPFTLERLGAVLGL